MITVYEWTLERLENSERAAQAKSGAEREGWLEDVAYWQLVNQAIAESPLAHTTPNDHARVDEENNRNEQDEVDEPDFTLDDLEWSEEYE